MTFSKISCLAVAFALSQQGCSCGSKSCTVKNENGDVGKYKLDKKTKVWKRVSEVCKKSEGKEGEKASFFQANQAALTCSELAQSDEEKRNLARHCRRSPNLKEGEDREMAARAHAAQEKIIHTLSHTEINQFEMRYFFDFILHDFLSGIDNFEGFKARVEWYSSLEDEKSFIKGAGLETVATQLLSQITEHADVILGSEGQFKGRLHSTGPKGILKLVKEAREHRGKGVNASKPVDDAIRNVFLYHCHSKKPVYLQAVKHAAEIVQDVLAHLDAKVNKVENPTGEDLKKMKNDIAQFEKKFSKTTRYFNPVEEAEAGDKQTDSWTDSYYTRTSRSTPAEE